jgi:hypothetical protein
VNGYDEGMGAVWHLLLVPEDVPVGVPIEYLDSIAAPTPEDEQVTREWVEGHGRFDEVGQRIESLPHIG